MEYRLSLTPRLLAVGLCAVMALLVLLFALGFQVGQNMAPPPPLIPSVPSVPSLPPLASAAPAAGTASLAAASPATEAAPVPAENPARYVRPTGEAP